jgi:hypothetical protein
MRTERAIDHSELAVAALVALPEPLPRSRSSRNWTISQRKIRWISS